MTEKQILSGIEHPFLVKLYSAFQDEKKLYYEDKKASFEVRCLFKGTY